MSTIVNTLLFIVLFPLFFFPIKSIYFFFFYFSSLCIEIIYYIFFIFLRKLIIFAIYRLFYRRNCDFSKLYYENHELYR
ncbi:MAG: hypothetical protein AYK18_09400 [Theionarchaea archaeon DG-70]|nr:MAG: hypothetical protein AYK18_09400 [Theionarchaea archaeon DG-70]